MSMDSIRARIVMADDHPVFTAGLRRLVETEHEIVASVTNGDALVVAVAEHAPDVVLADISMPGLNGIEATRRIIADHPRTKVILLTMHDDATYAAEALDAGATGYVPKQSDPEEILTAIREALAGEIFIAPSLASAVLRIQHRRRESGELHASELTQRQREILALLTQGRSAKEIAAELYLSPKTVEYHKYRMMKKLGVESNAELIQYAIKHGIGEV